MLGSLGMLVALLAPSIALAAYNDVSLRSGAILSVNSITLNVTGSSSLVQSIAVSSTSFTVTMEQNSTLEINSPDLNQLAVTNAGNVTVTNTCTSAVSKVVLDQTGGSAVTVTITPSTTVCSSTTSTSGGGSIASGGGGGGGSTSSTSAVTTTPTTTSWAPVSGLTESQVTSILDVLRSFNAEQSVIDMVNASLHGQASSNTSATGGTSSFSKDLQLGSTGAEVKALQQYLNTHGYKITASGAGSPGYETMKFGAATRAALIKLQKAAGLTPPAGYFGVKTRAYISAHP